MLDRLLGFRLLMNCLLHGKPWVRYRIQRGSIGTIRPVPSAGLQVQLGTATRVQREGLRTMWNIAWNCLPPLITVTTESGSGLIFRADLHRQKELFWTIGPLCHLLLGRLGCDKFSSRWPALIRSKPPIRYALLFGILGGILFLQFLSIIDTTTMPRFWQRHMSTRRRFLLRQRQR